MTISQLVACFNKIVVLHKKMKSDICKKYNISQTAFSILMCLNDNDISTAERICNISGMKPPIVSIQVEKLIKLGYIISTPDISDRRKQLLVLSNDSAQLIDEGAKMQQICIDTIFEGIPPNEIENYYNVAEKMLVNIDNCKNSLDFIV